MEIEHIRKELTNLLNSIVKHSSRYSEERPIPSLEISFVLTKINKMQENLVVLRHLLKEQEKLAMQNKKQGKSRAIITDNVGEIVKTVKTENDEKDSSIANSVSASISTLVDSLTLNDRYLFANELFDKDMNAFNELVKSIDNSGSLNAAKQLLSVLNWDEENEYAQTFQNLVERRFLS